MMRWYIQNEVVSGAYGSGNKFGIERIRRFKVPEKSHWVLKIICETRKLVDF